MYQIYITTITQQITLIKMTKTENRYEPYCMKYLNF